MVYKDHGVEFHEITDEQRNAFMRDVTKVAKAIQATFNPTKINYGAYADTLNNLHMHLVTKYKDAYGFGNVFEMNPKKTYLSENGYVNMIEKIKANL